MKGLAMKRVRKVEERRGLFANAALAVITVLILPIQCGVKVSEFFESQRKRRRMRQLAKPSN